VYNIYNLPTQNFTCLLLVVPSVSPSNHRLKYSVRVAIISLMKSTITKVAYYSKICYHTEFQDCTVRGDVFRLRSFLMTWFLFFIKRHPLVQHLLGDRHPDVISQTVFPYKKKRPYSATSHLPDQRWSPQLGALCSGLSHNLGGGGDRWVWSNGKRERK
jgi:hypothetical protein